MLFKLCLQRLKSKKRRIRCLYDFTFDFFQYFCLECKLFDDENKEQYHCKGCGICRIGDQSKFFHCDGCNMCLPINLKGNHKVRNIFLICILWHLIKNDSINSINKSFLVIVYRKFVANQLPCLPGRYSYISRAKSNNSMPSFDSQKLFCRAYSDA